MCQVLPNCAANPFTDAARAQASKKRPRCATTPVGSLVSVEAMHYNLRIKRVATTSAALSHAFPYPTAAKIKSRPRTMTASVPQAPAIVSRDLNAEVKTLQRKMTHMQAQVQGAADGIHQLRQLISVLAMQRHRAAMLVRSTATTTFQ